jgi:hypothetical protein
MTLFGKILVLLNLGLALVLAAWSFNIYANGIDWTDRKDTRTTPPRMGQFALRKEKLDELGKGIDPAQKDWLNERAQLAREEKHLADERLWYDKELRYVLTGPARGRGIFDVAIATQDDPNTGVKRGQVLLDNQGYPQLVPIRDPNNVPLQLQSLAEYNTEDNTVLRSLGEEMAKHAAQIAESNGLTDKIIGDKDKGVRGLQQRIYDEQAKNAAVIAEIKLIEPQLLNALVELQTVNKRREQMLRRIEELKRTKVASK